MDISIWQSIISLLIIVFTVWLNVRILNKAGYSGSWAITQIIPVVNIIMIWVFAFSDWPKLTKSETVLNKQSSERNKQEPVFINNVNNATTPPPVKKSNTIINKTTETRKKNMDHEDTNNIEPEDLDTPDFYLQVWEEIESNSVNKGMWAKSFALAEGDKEKTKANYIKLRVPDLEQTFLEEKKLREEKFLASMKRREETQRLAEIKLEQSRPENQERHGIFISAINNSATSESLALKPGDVIIFYNEQDFRGKKQEFLQEMSKTSHLEHVPITIIRDKEVIHTEVPGGDMDITVGMLA